MSKRGALADLKKLYRTASASVATGSAKPVASHASPPQSTPKPTSLSDEDKALFKQQMRGVRQLQTDARLEKHYHPSQKHKNLFQAKRAQAEGVEAVRIPLKKTAQSTRTADYYLAHPDYAKSLLKKARAGEIPVSATLDLHHYTVEKAWEALNRFISSAYQHHIPCVCIIHGKGIGSPNNEAILKPHVQSWLQNFDYVKLYCTAPVNIGGDGALIVLLKTEP